jgi:DNA-binding NarL/FixJ family response regulator
MKMSLPSDVHGAVVWYNRSCRMSVIKGSDMMALIVARPGPLRDSLKFFLLTLPQIATVHLADDVASALRAVAEYDPVLVLIDTNGFGETIWATLRRIKAESLRSRCLVLVDDARQQEDAVAAGADVVLVKGCPATKLFETVEGLLCSIDESLA